MSDPIDIAEAVVAAFTAAHAAGRISQAVTATRLNVTRPKLDNLVDFDSANPDPAAIKVFILPDDEQLDEENTTREMLVFDYPIVVGIAARVKNAEQNADADAMHQLRQDLKDYFFKEDEAYSLPDRSESAISIETVTDCHKETLREKRTFLAEFVVTFKGGRLR